MVKKILVAIAAGATQADIARAYAEYIRAGDMELEDTLRINDAIRARWPGRTALLRVKTMAWKIVEATQ